jgi:hypothetical protein
MSTSILDSVKKNLGLASDYTDFDLDVTTHINAAFGELLQLGVGPATGFFIQDNTASWESYTDRPELLGMVQALVYLKVRLSFDPPATSFTIEAMQKLISEWEWRINVQAETPPVVISVASWWDVTDLADFPAGAITGDWGYDTSTWDIYVKDQQISTPALWDLTSLDDFPDEAVIGELGFDTATGNVWRKAA